MEKTNSLVENKALRDRYINKVDVLDKVKKLSFIPEMECLTLSQVANYYEVDNGVIRRCYQRHQDEINSDGVTIKSVKDFKEVFKNKSSVLKNLKQEKGKMIIQIDDNTTLVIPNRGIYCFNKRSVLRFGMLLRDSQIAKEVRTQLLDAFEPTAEESPELPTSEINKEQALETKKEKEVLMDYQTKSTVESSTDLVESKSLRDQYISRVEVLDKVKKLFLIPEMECMTTSQVADYYEVDIYALRKCYQRNKSEIDSDGVITKTPIDFKNIFSGTFCPPKDLKQEHGKLVVQIDDNVTLVIPNCGTRCFSKRAVLRFGMLLRDSKVAKEVRTQLLNVFENTAKENPELLTAEITKEQELLMNIGKSYASGVPEEILIATSAYSAYLKRHNERLQNENNTLTADNEKLSADNNILAGNILEWSNRASANRVVRLAATKLKWKFSAFWCEVYKELLYKYGINLKARCNKSGKSNTPYIEFLHDNEWKCFYKTIAAMLQQRYVNPSEIFKQAKLESK